MIPVNIPNITEDDITAVSETLRGGWISGDAPIVSEFEKAFAAAHGQSFGVAVPNGSLAIDFIFRVLDIGPDDEIILPAFAIISCLSEVLRLGATPVFVDSDTVTWNMDVTKVEAAVTEKTKAILAVHTYGLPVDMDSLLAIAKKYEILVIEDAAESHGLQYKDRPCGSMGFASTFSFYANKNITTGEGGMILSSNEKFVSSLRYYRNLAFKPPRRFVHDDIGWNLRFSGLQAALGLSQLQRLDESIRRRREIARAYREALAGIPGLSLAPEEGEFGKNDYWVVGISLDKDCFPPAVEIAERILSAGVQTRPFFYPLHLQPVFKKSSVFLEYHLSVAEWLGDYGLYLPNGLGMSDEQLSEAAQIVAGVFTS